MTNFRYTCEVIEVYPVDTTKGKKIRIVHHYRECSEAYFAEEAVARAKEIRDEHYRKELTAKIEAARNAGASFYDLGNGIRVVWPSLLEVPRGVQPLTTSTGWTGLKPKYVNVG